MTLQIVLDALEELKQFTNGEGHRQIEGIQVGVRNMGKMCMNVGKGKKAVVVSVDDIMNWKEEDLE